MAIIRGSTFENLTMADLDRQKTTLKILSERNYIKCLKLDLEASDPYMEYEEFLLGLSMIFPKIISLNSLYTNIPPLVSSKKSSLISNFSEIFFSFSYL